MKFNDLFLLSATATLLVASACGDDPAAPEQPCDLDAVGHICTIAGNGESGYSGDDGDALDVRMSLPQDTLTASDGTIYVLDWNNHRIRKIGTDGVMRHVAGRGELGGTGNALDDPANSDFNHPTGMIFDEAETSIIIAAWHNSKIRILDLVTDPGAIHDACGDGRRSYFGDGGPAATATLDLPASVAASPTGELVVMDQANQVLRVIDSSGTINRMAGRCIIDMPPPKGPGPCAPGVEPVACPAPSGKFTCGDPATDCGYECGPGYVGDGGPAMDMRMAQPVGQSADPAGRIAYKDGNLYFADTGNSLIRMIDTDGIVHRIAGTPPVDGMAQRGYEGDGGPALSAKLRQPVDLAFAADGTLYFSDPPNHCVRAIDPAGIIRTVAGTCGTSGTEGDGGLATEAQLKRPYGIEVVGNQLLISDTGNNQIRRVLLE